MKNGKMGTIQKSLLWSGGSEIAVKLILPISNMILARILLPEFFGVLAICIMVISFLDIITDAGFGKYLVQYEFKNEKQLDEFANVAFWSNLILSLVLFTVVLMNKEFIANVLGAEKYASVIAVSCIQLIFTSISSIQMGLMRRAFQFKELFVARVTVAVVPLVITVPLAIVTNSYWSLIIGNIVGAALNAIILFISSKWKPRLYYSFDKLKQMYSFSFWSLCEALAHWCIFWVDTFIVLQFFSAYYLGIYKNSANMIMSIIGMIIAATSPVLLSVLSRIKNENEFFHIFLQIEKIIMYILFPMGIGIFFFRETVTIVLFGSQWLEASNIIGTWALMMVVSIVIYSFPAEAFKAKGIPKILFLYQIAYLVFLIPICIAAAKVDFWTFVYVRGFCIIFQVILCIIFIRKFLQWNVRQFISNIKKPLLSSVFVVLFCVIAQSIVTENFVWQFIAIFMIIILYLVVLNFLFKKDIMYSLKVINEKKI